MAYRSRYTSNDRLILVEPSQATAATCALPMTTATRGKDARNEGRKEGRKKESEETSLNTQLTAAARGLFSWLAIAPAACNGMCPVATNCRQNVKLLRPKQGKTPVST